MSKTVVVGGGIVGMTAAYFARQQGKDVTLIESTADLGGLLKSDCNEYGSFDYGTHIAASTGIEKLDNFLFSDLSNNNSYIFKIGRSGNFFQNKLSHISPYVNSSFLPKTIFLQGCMELLSADSQLGNNLEETLINRYGEIFYHHIFKSIVKKNFACSAKYLANECLNFFDMGRMLAFNRAASERLKTIDLFNDKIGFHSASKGGEKYYPKSDGIGYWIKGLTEKLLVANIDIKKNTRIKAIDFSNSIFNLKTDSKSYQANQLVWTLSSGLLNQLLPTGIQGNKPLFRKTALYDFVFDKPIQTNCYYINIYDEKYLSNRITNYQNLQEKPTFYACTVELLKDDDFDFKKATEAIKQELFDMGLVTKNTNCLFKQHRLLGEGFPVLTNENVKQLRDINQYYQENFPNIILLGRSSAKGFFTSELLIDSYLKNSA